MLSPEERNELKRALEAKRATLRAELDMPVQSSNEDSPGDEADSSVDLEEIDREAGERDNARADLAEVEHALTKFDLGTYGLCELGGEPIPLARLRVLPEARYDAQHEAEVEARQRP